MPISRSALDAIVITIFGVALLLEGIILYVPQDRILRLSLGLLVLLLTIWLIVVLLRGVAVEEAPPEPPLHQRRFFQLRGRVDQLLGEIRRLNWLVVDTERGVRERDAAMQELDAIEKRLHTLILQIRSAAGRESSDIELGDATNTEPSGLSG